MGPLTPREQLADSLTPEDVLHEIQVRKLVNQPRMSPSGSAVDGEIDLEGQLVAIRVDYSSTLRLPTLLLEPPDSLGVLPHLDREICYQDKEGLVLDRRNPGAVLEWAIERARGVLLDGLSGRNHSDFSAEFATIWSRRQDAEVVWSVLEVGGPPRFVVVVSVPNIPSYVADEEAVLRAFFGGGGLSRARNHRRGIYVPLKAGASLVPPAPRGPMWNGEDVRELLLPHVDKKHEKSLAQLLKKGAKRIEHIFFSLPTGLGGHSLFGLKAVVAGDLHPLVEGAEVQKITPLRPRRVDRRFLIPRGGGEVALSERKVLLVGCGAVGGLIAQGLSRTGIGTLDLVDPDGLSEENTFRHVLGREDWEKNKAEAIMTQIQGNVPYVKVEAHPHRIEDLIKRDEFRLAAYDVVISAIGDPTVEMYLNDRIFALEDPPFGLYGWVEPMGIGGHVLLTGSPEGGGCFECIFTSADDPEEDRRVDRLSFAAPGQEFGRELAGCGSLHTPFGFADAAKTAGLAVDLTVSALMGKERTNVVDSWKGNADGFAAQGFRTSQRFEVPEHELRAQRRWASSPRCPVCARSSDAEQ